MVNLVRVRRTSSSVHTQCFVFVVLSECVKVREKRKMSGPECCSNPPTLNPNAGSGHVDKLCGLNAYFSSSPHSNRAILLVSDVFGYEAPNLRDSIMMRFMVTWVLMMITLNKLRPAH